MIAAAQLIGGFLLLLFGAELLVRGAAGIAKRLGVSTMIIGVTVVAYGTTAPEFVVSVDATIGGSTGLAIGNVVGSNIANVLLILGCAGLIAPISRPKQSSHLEASMMVAATGLFVLLGLYGVLYWWTGVVLLLLLVGSQMGAYMRDRHVNRNVNHADPPSDTEAEAAELAASARLPWPYLIGLFVAGLAGVLVGAHFLVEGAVTTARTFGVPEATIGLTLVAVGTSLPELATAVVAARRNHAEMAVGNVIGANMFNMLGLTGVVSLFGPIAIPHGIAIFDQWVMLGAAIAVPVVFLVFRGLDRRIALVLLALYAAYVFAQFHGMSGVANVVSLT